MPGHLSKTMQTDESCWSQHLAKDQRSQTCLPGLSFGNTPSTLKLFSIKNKAYRVNNKQILVVIALDDFVPVSQAEAC